MKAADYLTSKAGRVIQTPEGYAAFVPSPPQTAFNYSTDIVLALSRADTVLSELSGLGRALPNPHLLIAPYVRREAVLSSRIEGTEADLSDLFMDEAMAEQEPVPAGDVREVRNYVTALEYGLGRLPVLPLSLRLVRELHEKLMHGVRGSYATPGEFRRSQNWIGAPGSTPADAIYVPPPPIEMQAALDAWEKFLHHRGDLPDLLQCALMHENFEAIHPFLDGNGRIGRLLITLFLVERGRLSQPLLYISDYIEAHRTEYYAALQRIRTHGDWPQWFLYFLTAVERSANKALVQARLLLDLREELRAQFVEQPRVAALVDVLFANPYTTIKGAAGALGVSAPTAGKAIRALATAGVVEEITGQSWGRVFVARPILEAIRR